MLMQNRALRALCLVTAFLQTRGLAESLETQSNAVPNGTIQVVPDDPDRSGWEDVPWYDFDDDFVAFYPVDIDRVQIAHDDSHLFIRIETLEWDVDETWRVGTYIDTDRDHATGYTGNFLPVGADYFLEDALAFSFTAPSQADWGWAETGDVERDQSNKLDLALAIPRVAIGNATEFDFILFANNFCCDFQMPDDIYPNEPGGFFTYELGEVVAAPGDCNGDGMVDAMDLACVGTIPERDVVLAALNTLPGDLDGNGDVAFTDFLSLSANFGSDVSSYTEGDIDLSGNVAFADFLVMSENFGKRPTGAAPVPEPVGYWTLLLGVFAVLARRSHRYSFV